MSEQIRFLTADATLAGKIVSLDNYREGTTKTGVPYVSFKGKIQCGTSPLDVHSFDVFSKAVTSQGKESKAYPAFIKWFKEAKPLNKCTNEEEATYAELKCKIIDNPYVDKNEKLWSNVTSFRVTMQPGDFKNYKADIDLEGSIVNCVDEVVSDQLTGRKIYTMVSRDMYGSTLEINKIVADRDTADKMDDAGYDIGITTTLFISLIPNGGAGSSSGRNGFGQDLNKGRCEWVLTGAGALIGEDSPKNLSEEVVVNLRRARVAKLKEIEEKGYQGSASDSGTATSGRNSFSVTSNTSVFTAMEDDIPF